MGAKNKIVSKNRIEKRKRHKIRRKKGLRLKYRLRLEDAKLKQKPKDKSITSKVMDGIKTLSIGG